MTGAPVRPAEQVGRFTSFAKLTVVSVRELPLVSAMPGQRSFIGTGVAVRTSRFALIVPESEVVCTMK